MNLKGIWRLASLIVLVLVLVACGSDDSAKTSSDSGAGSTGGSQAESVGEAPGQDPAGEAIPEDVPVMPGAYDLDVIRDGTQVNYTVDGNVDVVMTWYQEELAAIGWTETRSPDTNVGAIGSMVRQNEAEDVLSINMQYNQNADFTTIAIAVSREN